MHPPKTTDLLTEKRDYLLSERAITSDASAKFELKKRIESIEAEIATLQDETNDTSDVHLHIAPTRLFGAEHLLGRERDLTRLNDAWDASCTHVISIVAPGGTGKTSLVAEWMARKAASNWPGFENVFDWSFHSPNSQVQGLASADVFLANAFEFFGDKATRSNESRWNIGARLVGHVVKKRTLLVLDGLELLQLPEDGRLKDDALTALMKGLAQHNSGLCIVTTRLCISDLDAFRRTTAPVIKLRPLSTTFGVQLLRELGVCGTAEELKECSVDCHGDALTLSLLGRYLCMAYNGDVRRRDQVELAKADAHIEGGRAFKTMAAYEKWLAEAGEHGVRSLAVLHLLGLLRHPASLDCFAFLCRPPTIDGLTEAMTGLGEADWNLTFSFLAKCGLIRRNELLSIEAKHSSQLACIDAHPLIREYFARQVREHVPTAWRSAHQRLSQYYQRLSPDPRNLIEVFYHLIEADDAKNAFLYIASNEKYIFDLGFTGLLKECLMKLTEESAPRRTLSAFAEASKDLIMARVDYYHGRYNEALLGFEKVFGEIAEGLRQNPGDISLTELKMPALEYRGLVYRKLENFDYAAKDFTELREIAGQCNNAVWEGYAIADLGLVYRETGNQRRAVEHFETGIMKTRELLERIESGQELVSASFWTPSVAHVQMGDLLALLAYCHLELGRVEEAWHAIEQAWAELEHGGEYAQESYYLGRLACASAFCQASQGNWPKAIEYAETAFNFPRRKNNVPGEIAGKYCLGVIYLKKAEANFSTSKKDLQNAKSNLINCLDMLESRCSGEMPLKMARVHKALSFVFAAQRKDKDTNFHHEKACGYAKQAGCDIGAVNHIAPLV